MLWEAPWHALVAQASPLHAAALLASLLAFAACAWFARERWMDVAVVGVLLLVALAVTALVPLLAIVAVFVLARANRRAAAALVGAFVALAAVGAILTERKIAAEEREVAELQAARRDPRGDVARWRARKNLFHARWAARAWARQEKESPADGYLALAQLDHELGDDVKADKAIKSIMDRGPASAKVEAERLRATWGHAP